MRRKISDRTRAQAIAICEQRSDVSNEMRSDGRVRDETGSSQTALELAWHARDVAVSFGVYYGYRWLEASGLLRDGWCPGDPVVRL